MVVQMLYLQMMDLLRYLMSYVVFEVVVVKEGVALTLMMMVKAFDKKKSFLMTLHV